MFDEYYEDLYRDRPGSPYSEIEPEEETIKCALCNEPALSLIQVEINGTVTDDGEYFCAKHTQDVINEHPGCYDPGENLRVIFDI